MRDADWTVPASVVQYKGATRRAQIEYMQSPEYAQREEQLNWLSNLLNNDEEFNNSETVAIANQRVYDLITNSDHKAYFMNGNFIPQFDNEGNLIFQNYTDEPLVPEALPQQQVRSYANEKINYQSLISETSGDRYRIGNKINSDAQVQNLLASGDTVGVNRRIREIFLENRGTSVFSSAIDYDDPNFPQFTEDGRLVYQKFSDPSPTDPIETQNEVVEEEEEEEEEVAIQPQVTRESEIARKRGDIAYRQQTTRRGPGENLQGAKQTSNIEQEPRQRRQNVEREGM